MRERVDLSADGADGEAELPWFYIFGFAKIALPLSLLLSLSLTRWTLQLAFRRRLRRASLGTETPSQRTESLMARLDKLEVRRAYNRLRLHPRRTKPCVLDDVCVPTTTHAR